MRCVEGPPLRGAVEGRYADFVYLDEPQFFSDGIRQAAEISSGVAKAPNLLGGGKPFRLRCGNGYPQDGSRWFIIGAVVRVACGQVSVRSEEKEFGTPVRIFR